MTHKKKQQSIDIKCLYSNTSYSFAYENNSICKWYIKIFIKRKTKAGKAYVYLMLLSFRTSVAYKRFFSFTPDPCVRCEVAFVRHNSIFYQARKYILA